MYEKTIQQTVGALRLGEPLGKGSLCILPLLSTAAVAARYVLLDQALSRGTLTITEVSEAGSVPHLQATNQGPWPVLIYDGEELVGAKQNRIANATILVGVGKTVLPVSCVEQGRWSHRSRAFSAGVYASHPSLRQAKERQVREHLGAHARRSAAVVADERTHEENQCERARRYASDQGAVWDEVRRTAHVLKSSSPTMAMADTYAAGESDLEVILRACGLDPSAATATVGALVFLGSEFVCLDVLQPAKRFSRLYPKLLRGYALEALLRKVPVRKGFDAEAAALRLFAEILDAAVTERPAADLGQDVRLEDKRVSGSGLIWEEELIQLSMFPKVVA